MKNFLKAHKRDLIIIAAILVSTIAVSSAYLPGQVLSTGYQDWMYHAYRALSIKQHGLISWDNVWDNGLSYWRGYQLVGTFLTVIVSTLFSLSITKAMLVLTVASFALFHIGVYILARVMKLAKGFSLLAVALSLLMINFWLTTGSFSIMFAALFSPYLLILWQLSRKRVGLKPIFALSVGLSFYIHPLLAVTAGFLWLIGIFLDSRNGFKRNFWTELLIIVAVSFFYWFTLQFVDYGAPDIYQLSAEFTSIVSGLFTFDLVFYIIGALVLLAAILRPSTFKPYSQYLFWFVVLLFVINLITINVPGFEIFNRFQLYRLGYFVAPVICILFAEGLNSFRSKINYRVYIGAICLVYAIGCTQAFIFSGVYGNEPAPITSNAVQDFVKSHPNIQGTIYTDDTTAASYSNPSVRLSSGYNDQLLPQQVNVRLAHLLGSTSPNYSVDASDLTLIANYVRVLGIQYIFLPQNSPYIAPLTNILKFKTVTNMQTANYSQTVLTPPWPINYAYPVDCSEATQTLSTPKFPTVNKDQTYGQLDTAVQSAANIIAVSNDRAINVTFPAKDQISLTQQSSGLCILLNQSYSKSWNTNGVKISPTSYGMMIIQPTSQKTITLKHTWGAIPYIQILATAASVLLTVVLVRRYRIRGHHE